MAADVYLALPDADRDAITTAVATRLGSDWLGSRHGDADTLLTTPGYAAHLHAELAARGHLQPTPAPTGIAPPGTPTPATAPARQRGLPAPMERPLPRPGIEITW